MIESYSGVIPVAFVADLHLFSRRSRGHLIEESILDAARRSRVCVLGGDIFDFKWSQYRTIEASLHAAVDWLKGLVARVPECQFHFILGNHDDHPQLVSQLPAIEHEHQNFHWDRFYLRLGDAVFLHGDAADRRMSVERLRERRERLAHRPQRRWAHGLYGLLVGAQVHRLIPHAVYRPAAVADRLAKYLKEIGHGPETGLRHVCYGHTHRPMSDYERGGLVFHNGGAPIGRAKYSIIEIEIHATDLVSNLARPPVW